MYGHAAVEGMPPLIGFTSHNAPDVLGLLAWLFHDQLIAALDIEISAMADDDHALDDQQRSATEALLLSERLATERIEEALIEAAEAEGRNVVRRPNADPRAILGLSSALPAPPDRR
jgi:hypothetical protein